MEIAFCVITAVMLLVEFLRPRNEWPRVTGWAFRSLAFTATQVLVVVGAGRLWDRWFEAHRPWSLENLGPITGTLIAFLVLTFVSYWQHRLKHVFGFLWRFLHQVHHSPRRIELLTSFYRNPLEILVNMIIMSAVLYLGVGADAKIALNVVLLLGLADMFYHWNIRTPYWLGFFIQRPESHCIHHLRGVHAYNYGDIPIWDMLFGTFKNVRSFNGLCGFADDNEKQIVSMFSGRDMSHGQYYHGRRAGALDPADPAIAAVAGDETTRT